MGWDGVYWIHVAAGKGLVMVMNLQVYMNGG